MSEDTEKLKTALLELPETERWELLGTLFDSLPTVSTVSEDDPEFDAMLRRRIEEMDSGRVKGVPANEVMERLRAKYAK
ncbi:Putative addiction module component [Gemmata sp. SH-PL17]|uniref:addiction module protein n=1 Tax=Gemmata sp. SH-PL17 TaxID=1630693 RepID=UPI00078D629A|nr:addiction module protein [Gemmata sp. SH-PL17]AMV24288.1 Putative addiction module component [Gemmata sp. SH-PL17]